MDAVDGPAWGVAGGAAVLQTPCGGIAQGECVVEVVAELVLHELVALVVDDVLEFLLVALVDFFVHGLALHDVPVDVERLARTLLVQDGCSVGGLQPGI